MANIRLTIEYEGTDYSGWQRQTRLQAPGSRLQKKTIQGVLEKALSKITKEKIKIIGAGRTDAGVHALGQVANFKTNSKMIPEEFKKALNSMLSKDIVIKKVSWVRDSFHAQFDVKSKHYKYIIYQGPASSPFVRNYVFYIPYQLELRGMREGAKYLIGRHDFSSFRLSGSSVRNSIRTITKLSITSQSNIRYTICGMRKNGRAIFVDIEANGFLYGMVRSIVGTLIEVGRGKISPSKVREILRARNRSSAGPSAPAKGLYIMEVRY